MADTVRRRAEPVVRHLALLALLVTAVPLGSCATTIRYADELADGTGRRTQFVRLPATLGSFAGLVMGVGVNVPLLGVTGPIYAYRRQRSGPPPDALSTLFFPAFVLWQSGKLIGAPFDVVEFAAYRAWLSADSLSMAEREEVERRYDRAMLPRYLVRPLFPSGDWDRDRAESLLRPPPFDRSYLLRSLAAPEEAAAPSRPPGG